MLYEKSSPEEKYLSLLAWEIKILETKNAEIKMQKLERKNTRVRQINLKIECIHNCKGEKER